MAAGIPDNPKALLADLQERSLIHDHTDLEAMAEALAQPKAAVYAGFDPTAESLHLGNFIAILGLMRCQKAGIRPIALVGGATGMIGDPSGRTTERELLDVAALERNKAGIRTQLERYLDFDGPHAAMMVDNADWTKDVSVLDFLRDVGKHFSVSAMLHKESVAERLKRETGISYTEFSYMLLQAYDFMVLARDHNCVLQLGGSDQWGNITAGTDLTRRMLGKHVHGLTFPLITNASGQKFGKSEEGALWLDPARTSPYQIYQYFINTDDRDVPRYLDYFTTSLSKERRDHYKAEHEKDPGKREAHRVLATQVTELIHSQRDAVNAEGVTDALFRGLLKNLDLVAFQQVRKDLPLAEISRSQIESGISLVDLLHEAGATPSKSEARRKIEAGAIYLNDVKTTEMDRVVTTEDLFHGSFILLRVGKRKYTVVEVTP